MKRFLLILAALVLIANFLQSVGAAGIKKRAVSLRVLQSVVEKGPSGEAEQLCGITRITGYVVDKKTRDIVLVGQVDPYYPPLNLDDLAVALRNVWHLYAKTEGHTRYYTCPGCSIDPDPKVIAELNDAGQRISEIKDVDQKRQALEGWKAIGRQPQKVRVLGVPFDSRFAKVMVDADYYMKRLTNGSVDLNINGFDSLMGMESKVTEKELDEGDLSESPGQSLNRFWFVAGESTFSDDDGMVTLESCPIKLLTENEFLTKEGKISGLGRSDPMAQVFADGFTRHYNEIAAQRPIYKELEALFRFVALANIMKDENALSSASLDLNYLMNRYGIANVPVNRAVTGQTNIQEMNHEVKKGDATYKFTYWHMSCGGVSMDIQPKRIRKVYTAAKALAKQAPTVARKVSHPEKPTPKPVSTKNKVLNSRKSADSLSWDLPD